MQLADPQSWNSYAYARNNPLKYNDPDGEFWDTVVDLSFTGYDTWKGLYHGTQALGGYASQGVGKLIGREGMENAGRQQASIAVGQLKGDLDNLAIDAAGTALPFVPVAGIKVVKNVDKASDVGKKLVKVEKISEDSIKAAPLKRGNAPVGRDGFPVEIHHTNQKPSGPLVEMTRTEHRLGDNFKVNHTNTGSKPSNINRQTWSAQRSQYWRQQWDTGRFNQYKKK